MRIGLDAEGGDRPPGERIRGALAARELLGEDDRIVLVGDAARIRGALASSDGRRDAIEVRPTRQAIGMNEAPVEALRAKPDSSIAVLARMHRAGELDAFISAGNTGATVAAAQMALRRLRAVHRPGIVIVTPTYHGPVAICDVGANVNCQPRHLHQYAIMASVYVNIVCGIARPRVALLSVGQEEGKGNELVKGALELLKGDPHIRFIGNVEGRDVFRGTCDVMVCDGFVGNVVLKLMEGMAEGVLTGMADELRDSMPQHVEAVKYAAQRVMTKYDFNEYGGAPLLGVAGICVICHGDSSERGIRNAVGVALQCAKHNINDRIVAALCRNEVRA
jgi:glycerol-3-phosphate acyltransferase PlsX